jgi:hypothetical protein
LLAIIFIHFVEAKRDKVYKPRDFETKIGRPSTAFGHSDRKKRFLTGRHNFVTIQALTSSSELFKKCH